MTAEQLGFGEKNTYTVYFLIFRGYFFYINMNSQRSNFKMCFGMFWLDLGYMLKAKHCRLGLLK